MEAGPLDQTDGLDGLVAVHRAVGDLRRGLPVVLRDGADPVLLVAAVETHPDPAALTARAGAPAAAVITAPRARALKLRDSPLGPIRVTRAGGLDAASARALADPEVGGVGPQGLALEPADAHGRTAIALVKQARLLPAALIARPAADAALGGLLALDLKDWAAFGGPAHQGLVEVTRAHVPLDAAQEAEMIAFRPRDGGKEHIAIVIGRPDPAGPVLTRLHSECFTGDLFGSLRCDCGDQLRGAIEEIAAQGGGVLLYLAQEGRGIGLVNKLRAYRLQDGGFDTLDANEQLGFDGDERVYRPAAAILNALGFPVVALMTNNPAKVDALAAHGIEVAARVPHVFPANGHNETYLRTKALRGGHLL